MCVQPPRLVHAAPDGQPRQRRQGCTPLGAHSTARVLPFAGTYLLCAYGLPAWFTLRLMGDRLSAGEAALLWALIPFSLLFSGVGLYGSVVSLVQDIQGGGEGGWSR